MKNAIFAVLQFVLFLVIYAVFSFVPVMHIQQVLGTTPDGTRIFIWDGLLLAGILFLAIAVIEAARRKTRAVLWTTASFALAAGAGLALKLGFLTR